ncbi:hypothetical protein [Acinetobacter sp.]|uniref:hypothetical protein n=1 Tax=Acinetobacter sp. TaxID=472 RepID=UPI000C08EA9D|nr:hypothetical protein [Acinetobacter sp.]MAK30908.1 hypothetical protein [Acinetobacter sp.]QDP47180.1 MAG: hypothetical protein GOVbin655_14 [Prokaryotic dsDNA virus sp.]|tara:strand:- start:3699 stop:3998 length:300 start_codon:yes stop_codon:yes gene_type:complete
MIQALLIKTAQDKIIKFILKKFKLDMILDYVEKPNELDIQMKQVQKTSSKQGKSMEVMEKDIAILKKDSHPPIFGEKDYKDILKRLRKLENGQKGTKNT